MNALWFFIATVVSKLVEIRPGADSRRTIQFNLMGVRAVRDPDIYDVSAFKLDKEDNSKDIQLEMSVISEDSQMGMMVRISTARGALCFNSKGAGIYMCQTRGHISHWKITRVNTFYTLEDADTGMCLELNQENRGASNAPEKLILNECNGNSSFQLFRIKNIDP